MRLPLVLHPDCSTPGPIQLSVGVVRPGPRFLSLHYSVSGAIEALRRPPLSAPVRADGLWKETCFEVFVRAPSEEGYWEFNFSPSTQWAAYRFDKYRSGMRNADQFAAPHIVQTDAVGLFGLTVQCEGPFVEDAALALSAVLVFAGGEATYWALAHPLGNPDFHAADCFAARLPPVRAS